MATTQHRGTRIRVGQLHKTFETSEANTQLTVSTPVGDEKPRMIRVYEVDAGYSGVGSTVTVTITRNSAEGVAYDTLLAEIELATAEPNGAWIPDGEILVGEGDTIDVTAPAEAGETSSISIHWEYV